MKLARWRDPTGVEYVGEATDEGLVACARIGKGREGDAAVVNFARRGEAPLPIADPVAQNAVRLLAPIRRPPSIRDFYAFEQHVRTARAGRGLEMNPDWYELPVFYFSNPHTIIGPDDSVPYPATAALDYELEVAAVVGTDASNLEAAAALDAIVGYTVFNDFSARDLQRREMAMGLGPAKGKDFAGALGPVLVTPDELAGSRERPRAAMVARVNGDEWSRGDLADIHHSFGELVSYASRDSLVRSGDVIGSGTVGTGCILELSLTHGSSRYPWLRPGDVVELEVEGIGILRNRVAERRRA
ncbi:MAG: fumarylacetoacetate hydrolase family protein [Nitriliruptorales bacterium]|nr:fumarylacetoacetate hydrolase family protein [Nitriliruptorales bacterium]